MKIQEFPPRWGGWKSEDAARSSNLFVRFWGRWLDRRAGFHSCPGHRHWGPDGAAGILPVYMTPKGLYVLLGKRAGGSQDSGTWSTFGGAIDGSETTWQAAVRETSEEVTGLEIAESATVLETLEAACPFGCGWSYTTYVVDVLPAESFLPRVRALSWEVSMLAWVPVHQVADRNLHPAFAKAWPGILEFIAEPGSDDPEFYDGAELARLAEEFNYPKPRPAWKASSKPATRSSWWDEAPDALWENDDLEWDDPAWNKPEFGRKERDARRGDDPVFPGGLDFNDYYRGR